MASSFRALNVVLVVEASSAGVGRHVRDLSTELAKRDHTVHIIWSPTRADSSFLDFASSPPSGVSLYEIPMERLPGSKDVGVVRRTRRLLKSLATLDVVHGHSSKGGAIARLAGFEIAPTVATPHAVITSDPSLSIPKKALYGAAELALGLLGGAIVAVSQEEQAQIRRLGVPGRRIHLIPNGVGSLDLGNRDPARARLGLSKTDRAIGFVGRLVPQKDPLLALAAFSRLGDPSTTLIIIGDGPLRDAVEAEIHRLGIDQKVMLLGEQPARDLMPAFDLLVLSSRYEGLSYVVLEALSAGIPIAATCTGGTQELLGSGAGLVVPVGDEEALSRALSELLRDRDLAARAADAAVQVSRRYGLEAMVDAYEQLYRSVGRSRNGSRDEEAL